MDIAVFAAFNMVEPIAHCLFVKVAVAAQVLVQWQPNDLIVLSERQAKPFVQLRHTGACLALQYVLFDHGWAIDDILGIGVVRVRNDHGSVVGHTSFQ